MNHYGHPMIRRTLSILTMLGTLAAPVAVDAQTTPTGEPPAHTFTLEEALAYAVTHYPTMQAALEQVNASAAGVTVARGGYLPRLDSVWQTNRATVNNVTGLLLPQSVLSSISGPPPAVTSGQSVWGSAVGALFSWEPFDFGLRSATVRSAEAAVARARADSALTRLDVQATVGAAYLAVVAAERAVSAAQADLERRVVLARSAHALVDNQLRPGAEASRADAEQAAAQTRVILSRQGFVLAQITLGRVLGIDGPVSVNASALLGSVPSAPAAPQAPAQHPLTQSRQAAVDAARAQETVLARTDRPRVFLQSNVFARGSGAGPGGHLEGGAEGLWVDRANWAAGVQVVFPNLFGFATLHARRTASAATTRAESARVDEAVLMVTSQQRAAAAMVEATRAVLANTPVQLSAARQSEAQARARYEAGLASVVEVAETQDLLVQAEYQSELARVDVWRALLAEALAHGDLTSFVRLVQASAGAR
jgi:outer membrane protein TolC